MSVLDKIQSADDIGYEDVEVPEWDHAIVRVASISLAKRDELLKAFEDKDGNASLTSQAAEILTASLRDPETNGPVFETVAQAAEVLAKRDGAVVDRLVGVANRVCGFDTSAADQIEGAKKSPAAD